MSSVLYQSFNSNGVPGLRNELLTLRNQIADARKEISFLIKALNEKAPEVLEEFNKLKDQDTLAQNTPVVAPPSAVSNISRRGGVR